MDINTTDKEIEDYIIEQCGDLAIGEVGYLINPNYAPAILGISTDNRVMYSHNKMVEYLMEINKDWDYMDATEWINYIIFRVIPYAGNYPPIIVYDNIENL